MRRIELLDPTQSGRSAEHLENKLRDLVVGQDEAIRQIVTAYQTHLAGLSPVGRPIGNFLLLAVYRLWKNSHCRGDPRVAAAGFSIRNQDRLRGVSTRELVLDTEYPLVFNHSTRVYYFGSLAGRLGLKFDPELLYIGALFHDMGLTPQHSSKSDRFEWMVRTVRERSCASTMSLSRRSILCGQRLHYTPRREFHSPCIGGCAIDQRCRDVLGIVYAEFSDADREAIAAAYPRS